MNVWPIRTGTLLSVSTFLIHIRRNLRVSLLSLRCFVLENFSKWYCRVNILVKKIHKFMEIGHQKRSNAFEF